MLLQRSQLSRFWLQRATASQCDAGQWHAVAAQQGQPQSDGLSAQHRQLLAGAHLLPPEEQARLRQYVMLQHHAAQQAQRGQHSHPHQ